MSRGFSRGGSDRGFGGRGGGFGGRGRSAFIGLPGSVGSIADVTGGGRGGGRGGFSSYGPPDTVQGMSYKSVSILVKLIIRGRIIPTPRRIRDAMLFSYTNKDPILQRPHLPRKQDANR